MILLRVHPPRPGDCNSSRSGNHHTNSHILPPFYTFYRLYKCPGGVLRLEADAHDNFIVNQRDRGRCRLANFEFLVYADNKEKYKLTERNPAVEIRTEHSNGTEDTMF